MHVFRSFHKPYNLEATKIQTKSCKII